MSSYSEGQTHQLMGALEREGWTAADVTLLGQSSQLADIKRVLLGHAEIKEIEHLIDLAADPFVPTGWSVEEHQKGGQWQWNPSRVSLFLSDRQKSDRQKTGWVKGHDLRQELKGQKVLNANVLDFLLKHPELIPEEWKGKWIFFWGTIYRDPRGSLFVRYLGWYGGRWGWGYYWLESGWDVVRPALVLASLPAGQAG